VADGVIVDHCRVTASLAVCFAMFLEWLTVGQLSAWLSVCVWLTVFDWLPVCLVMLALPGHRV